MQKYLKIHSNDNVAVALAPLSKGLVVELGSQTVTLSDPTRTQICLNRYQDRRTCY